MTGLVDQTLARPRHHCNRPAIRAFGPPREPRGVPTVRILHPEGTRYHCDGCGTVWVVIHRTGGRVGNIYIAGGHEWRRETRAERRHRLGLRWWQRG